jgi:hypothetical protein
MVNYWMLFLLGSGTKQRCSLSLFLFSIMSLCWVIGFARQLLPDPIQWNVCGFPEIEIFRDF